MDSLHQWFKVPNQDASGVCITGATGTESFETEIEEAGVAGTGAIGTTTISNNLVESGVSGIGTVGTTTAIPTTYTVTSCINSSGNKYVINGTQQPTLSLIRGNTYVFDWSDSTCSRTSCKILNNFLMAPIIVDLSTPQVLQKTTVHIKQLLS